MTLYTKTELIQIALRPINAPQNIKDKVIENISKHPIYKFKKEFEKSTDLKIKHYGNNKFEIVY